MLYNFGVQCAIRNKIILYYYLIEIVHIKRGVVLAYLYHRTYISFFFLDVNKCK